MNLYETIINLSNPTIFVRFSQHLIRIAAKTFFVLTISISFVFASEVNAKRFIFHNDSGRDLWILFVQRYTMSDGSLVHKTGEGWVKFRNGTKWPFGYVSGSVCIKMAELIIGPDVHSGFILDNGRGLDLDPKPFDIDVALIPYYPSRDLYYYRIRSNPAHTEWHTKGNINGKDFSIFSEDYFNYNILNIEGEVQRVERSQSFEIDKLLFGATIVECFESPNFEEYIRVY